MTAEGPLADLERLFSRLLEWFSRHRRVLPWREDPEPYRVWISEIMLQQTQVKTVVPHFQRFMNRFPTLEDLAEADEETVVGEWSGLGYYSRARNLHRSARRMIAEHGSRVPEEYESLLALPGIGRYTAGAILSIAFGKPFPVVDGNVKRVMARLLGVIQRVDSGELWRLMETLVEHESVRGRVSELNQALMELGALVCRPSRPECDRCPLHPMCEARRRGIADQIPPPRRRQKKVFLDYSVVVLQKGDQFLMQKNLESPFLRGFWEFPKLSGRLGADSLQMGMSQTHGLQIEPMCSFGEVVHQITFRSIRFFPWAAQLLQPAETGETLRWLSLHDGGIPRSSYIGKIVRGMEREQS